MGSFSGLGIGLSFVFGCILMGLVAELYYLLWWKKKIANSTTPTTASPTTATATATAKEFQEFNLLFCWKKPKPSTTTTTTSQELTTTSKTQQQNQDLEIGLKHEEGIEAELMRLHNLHGPPRFLFTIKEESKEDMESDDGRSRKGSRTRSLSDLIIAVDGATPFLTPLSSPTLKSTNTLDSYNHHGINPLFESIPEAELSRLRSSPPPKFKFLRDAEDKLLRRLLQEEAEKKMVGFQESRFDGEKCGSFVKFLEVREKVHNQATQVLPLASSPTFQHSG